MSRFLLGGTFIVLLGVLGMAYFGLQSNASPSVTVSLPTNTTATTTQDTAAAANATTASDNTTTTTSGYTMAKVVLHNSASSCWTAINGNVYDLTNWINQHPGGQAPILSLCGTDGSAAFNGQHGGERRPANELAGFLLGPLSK